MQFRCGEMHARVSRIRLSLDNKPLRKRFVRSFLLLLTHNYATLPPRITRQRDERAKSKAYLYIILPLIRIPACLAKRYADNPDNNFANYVRTCWNKSRWNRERNKGMKESKKLGQSV